MSHRLFFLSEGSRLLLLRLWRRFHRRLVFVAGLLLSAPRAAACLLGGDSTRPRFARSARAASRRSFSRNACSFSCFSTSAVSAALLRRRSCSAGGAGVLRLSGGDACSCALLSPLRAPAAALAGGALPPPLTMLVRQGAASGSVPSGLTRAWRNLEECQDYRVSMLYEYK